MVSSPRVFLGAHMTGLGNQMAQARSDGPPRIGPRENVESNLD